MITDSRGRTIVLITSGAHKDRIGAINAQRPGDSTITVSIDIGGSVVQKSRDAFRPLAVGDTLAVA